MVQSIEHERFRDPNITERLLSMDAEFASFCPGFLTEVGNLHVHHFRMGDRVEVRVVSGEELEDVRERVRQFSANLAAFHEPVASGGTELLSVLENDLDRLKREFDHSGVDVAAVIGALRENGQASAALMFKRLAEARDKELPAPVCKACGEGLKLMSGLRKKSFTTLLGKIEIERRYYYCHACKQGVHPLDEWLDLVGKSLTPDVERLLLEGSAEFGSRKSTRFLGSWAGVQMSRSRVDREVRRLGGEAVEFESQEVEEADEGPGRSVIGIDGTGVPVRKSELKGRKGKQEDGTAKTREAKVFRICEVEQDEESGKVSMIDGSDTQSSKIDSVNGEKDGEDDPLFDDRFRREAVRQGTFHADEVVILSDGAPWIRNAAARVFSGMTIIFILDMFHALGWLSDALKAIYPTKSERILHLKRMKAMLKSGQVAHVLAELARHNSHEAVAKCIRYYNANLHRMRYHDYAERGLPLRSGLIEGSCKNVVADRLKRGGSRWSVKGANGIMAIRCLEKNNRITGFFDWRAAA